MTDWCILRCSASKTLDLARSLAEAGFETVCPVEVVTPQPKPKDDTSRPLRKPRQLGPVTKPLIPAIVFARADDLAELAAMAHSPALVFQRWNKELRRMVSQGHPEFSIFRDGDKFALIAERELDHLRMIERKRKPRGLVKAFHIGDPVKLTDGAFAGLRGKVVAVSGKVATVSFGGRGFLRDMGFPMWALLDDTPDIHVSRETTEQALIAKAA